MDSSTLIISRALDALETGAGETYFELVVRVFREHGNIELVLD